MAKKLNGWTTTKNIYLMKQDIKEYKKMINEINQLKKMCENRIEIEKNSIQRSAKLRLQREYILFEFLEQTIIAYREVINQIGKAILKERDVLYKSVYAFTKKTGQKIEMHKYSYKMTNMKAIGNHKLFGGVNELE